VARDGRRADGFAPIDRCGTDSRCPSCIASAWVRGSGREDIVGSAAGAAGKRNRSGVASAQHLEVRFVRERLQLAREAVRPRATSLDANADLIGSVEDELPADLSARRKHYPADRGLRLETASLMPALPARLVRMSETFADPVIITDADFGIYRRHGRQAVPSVRPRSSASRPPIPPARCPASVSAILLDAVFLPSQSFRGRP
jgi:hypothetical protein